jgi:hypothetical protein
MSRYALHEHCKTLLAAPPLTLRCNEKNRPEHEVFNVMGVIFTTNHKDGLYLPPDDARHYVCWSERERDAFREGYWRELYGWYEGGGYTHVAAYLDSVDLTGFDPKQPPERTPAFQMMVDAGRNPEESDLSDALDKMGHPPATCVSRLSAFASADFQQWLKESKNRKHIGNRFERAGYVAQRNEDDKTDGLWRVDEKRQTVYVRKELTESKRLAAVAELRGTKLVPNLSGGVGVAFRVVPA